jgi:hypothetical protein
VVLWQTEPIRPSVRIGPVGQARAVKTSIQSLFVTAARWFAIAIVFLATAELFARVDDAVTFGAPLLSPYTHDRLLLQDSLGFRGRPNYRYQKWRMNNAGFRGPDIAVAPAPGVIRVAVAGASETFGLYETEGAEYAARMQVLLDSVVPGRFEVINTGLFGMSLASMIGYFDRAILPVRPRLLFIYPSPAFYLDPTPPPLVYKPPALRALRPIHIGPWDLPPDFFESRLAEKGRDALKTLVPNSVVRAVRQWRLNRVRSAHGADWVWQSVPEDRMALMRQQLERLLADIRASGVRVAVVTHTNRFSGMPGDTLGPDDRHIVNQMSLYYPNASQRVMVSVDSVANAVIREVAAEEGAGVVEGEGRIPPTSRDFADYEHFTDAGADAMARIMVAGVIRLAGDTLVVPGANSVPKGTRREAGTTMPELRYR